MKGIPGYEGKYFACEDGRIFASPSKKRPKGCHLRPYLIGHGYEIVTLYKGDGGKKFLVHRLIASAFIPNPNNLREVNHIDADRLNNRPENLEWVTSKENKHHAIKRGLYKNLCTLSEQDVLDIRRMYATGNYFQADLAAKFKTSQGNISFIVLRKGWDHIS